METVDEQQILTALRRGDPNAFALIYNMYAGKSYNFVFSLVKDEDTAKDLVQDAFIKVYLKRDTVSKVDSFNAYLFRMLKNAVFDHFESEAVRRRYAARMALTQEEFAELVNQKVEADDLRDLIAETVSRMPEQRRTIFTLSRYKGVPNAEIAKQYGISIRTVENHLSNAMRDIRKAISHNMTCFAAFLCALMATLPS
ncbi:MAG: RNA polymerase sigma-70 factor [Bacteroidales bacterium]|nr:RNA polymerase sigma-70 factor [Bacteroidales bacterium]